MLTREQAVKKMTRSIADAFSDSGWTSTVDAAAMISSELCSEVNLSESEIGSLCDRLSPSFLIQNRIESRDAAESIREIWTEVLDIRSQIVEFGTSVLVPLDEIDSFKDANRISSVDVQGFAKPFPMAEDDIKKMVARIVGEPLVKKDWGGESDDLISGQVRFQGKRVSASFIFKGPSVKGIMKPKDLGKNGDQIVRMLKQPAELFIVQFVDSIDSAVRSQLWDGIQSLRSTSRPATGSLWEGVDTARLALAYDFVDGVTGETRQDAWTR